MRTKEATSLTFSICNFNRVDDTKDTKDFFLCAVCAWPMLLFYTCISLPLFLSLSLLKQKRPPSPQNKCKGREAYLDYAELYVHVIEIHQFELRKVS